MTQTTNTNQDLSHHQKVTQDQAQVKNVAFSEQVDDTVRKLLELIYDEAVQQSMENNHQPHIDSAIDIKGGSLKRHHVIDHADEALQEQV